MPSNNLTVAQFVAPKANIGSEEIEGDAPVFPGRLAVLLLMAPKAVD